MFSTFTADPDKNTPRPRAKRAQVARACDWCRLNRTKCDESQPCRNCRTRGMQCSNGKRTEIPTLSAANREIQRLRNTISALQGQSRGHKAAQPQDQAPSNYVTPPESDGNGLSPHDSPASYVPRSMKSSPIKEWKGVQIHAQGGAIYYGPLSSSYFGDRMGQFLSNALDEQPESQWNLRLTSPPNILTWNGDAKSEELRVGSPNMAGLDALSRAQEQFFLDLLWQSFHCIYPILIEAEFREHYGSLWGLAGDQLSRHSSALVDSVLAVCMQYGSTFLTSDQNSAEHERDDHVASVSRKSHALFRRAQTLLLDEIESPTIMTLQSYIYCIIYLHNTSLLNSAHTLLGTAVRVAQTLRLHLPPCDPTIREYQELYRRLWYTLVGFDCQLSLILGRPSLISVDELDFGLPGGSQEHAYLSGSMLITPGDEGISWLSFHVQSVRLLMTARGVQTAFYHHGARLLDKHNTETIYDDPFLLELLAASLGQEIGVVYGWARNVPQSLKTSRKGSGEPFSTERTPIGFNSLSPLWLQRQRILLELLYHHVQLSNFRPFIRLRPGCASMTPLSDCHSINCLNHAVTLTNIVHQILNDTDLLRGWYPVFQYQWDAAICILGFVLANPVCPPSPAARKAIQTAISCFEIMGKYCGAAIAAAKIVREVGSHAEMLVNNFHSSLSSRSPPSKRRKETSATVQVITAPALTPEYLQSLTSGQPFDISEFMNSVTSPLESFPFAVDESKAGIGILDGNAAMETPWMNDEEIMNTLQFFPEGQM